MPHRVELSFLLCLFGACGGSESSPDAGAVYTASELCSFLASANCSYYARCESPFAGCVEGYEASCCPGCEQGVYGPTSDDVQRCYEDSQIATCSDSPRLDYCLDVCDAVIRAGGYPIGPLCEHSECPDCDAGGVVFVPDAGR